MDTITAAVAILFGMLMAAMAGLRFKQGRWGFGGAYAFLALCEALTLAAGVLR